MTNYPEVLVERVAKEICAAIGWDWEDLPQASSDTKERCRRAARVALARIRQLALHPDEAQIGRPADALRRFEQAGKNLLPWHQISNAQRNRWKDKAGAVLRAFAEEIGP